MMNTDWIEIRDVGIGNTITWLRLSEIVEVQDATNSHRVPTLLFRLRGETGFPHIASKWSDRDDYNILLGKLGFL